MAADRSLAFEALADPTRRTILRVLADQGETSAGQLAAVIDAVGRTSVSSHLRVLRTAGLVDERRDGRYRLYSLQPRTVDEVMSFVAQLYRRSLTDLKQTVEAAEAGGTV